MERGFKNHSILNCSYEEATNLCSIVLPGDLIVEILQRLPVKSLLRFESVSKSWQFVIHNSKFIEKHLEYQKKKKVEEVKYLHLYNHVPGFCINDRPLTLCYCPPQDIGPITTSGISLISMRDDGNITTNAISHSPLPSYAQSLTMVGSSSNGLVCIKFCYNRSTGDYGNFLVWDRQFGIWNPATRKLKLLPTPQPAPASEFRNLTNTIVGFSYIPSTCNYKLVQILVFKSYHQDNNVRYSARVEVLNVGENSWREVVCQGQDEAIHKLGWQAHHFDSSKGYIHNRPILVKGCLHWLGILQHGEGVMVSFDLDKEVFTQTSLPYPNDYIKLAIYEDNLAAIVSPFRDEMKDYFDEIEGYFDEIKGFFQVWMYESTSRSWTKGFSFGPLPRDYYPVGFWADGEIIIKGKLQSSGGSTSKQYLYNLNNKEKKNFPCRDNNCNLVLEPYIESLVDF